MLTESFLITTLGGIGGVAVAFLSTPLLMRALPPIRDPGATALPLALHIEPNLRVLAFSLALCIATAVLFGLAPAIQASRADLQSFLRTVRASGAWRGRQALVVFEVALCTLLLAGAGLLARTFEQLHNLDTGFDRDHLVTFTTDPGVLGYTPQQATSVRNAWLERVRALPGVQSAAFAAIGLMHGTGMKSTIAPAGQKTTPSDFLNSSLQVISPEYFDTMGMHLISGRGFTEADGTKHKPRMPAIVNQAFVRRFFPGQEPLGRVFGGAGVGELTKDDQEIVGVVTDAKYRSMREPIPPTVYRPYVPDPDFIDRFVLHVRTRTRPESVIQPVREILRSIDAQLPIVEVHTLAEEVDSSLWSERLVAALASIFGALAALLAAVGLYGLLAYAVAQRTREIGIRMALGARPESILGLMGRQALLMVACGIATGLGAAVLAAPAVRGLLYGVAANDAATLLAAASFVALIAALAVAVPIARAVRVEPSVALRNN
jgi:predicted permease